MKQQKSFLNGSFEFYKLKGEVAKARIELISTSVLSGYRHKFGEFLCNSFISYRSTLIEDCIREKKKELDQKCILEQKYDKLSNVPMYDKFIAPNLKIRYSQYTIVALTRSVQF